MTRCTARTDRLNCGCCEDVRLDCDLPEDPAHIEHRMTLDTVPRTYIRWKYVTAYDPEVHTS